LSRFGADSLYACARGFNHVVGHQDVGDRLRVPPSSSLDDAFLGQAFERKCAAAVEHPVAQDRSAVNKNPGLVHECGQMIDHGPGIDDIVTGDPLSGLETEAADEDAEPIQNLALFGLEQRIAPFKYGAQRVMARQRGALSTSDQQLESLVQPLPHPMHTQKRQPGGGQFDGQGHAVQARADLDDGADVVGAQHKSRIGRLGSGDEQLNGAVLQRRRMVVSRRNGQCIEAVYALIGHPKRFLAGDQDVNARGAPCDMGCQFTDSRNQVFAVVQHEQQVPMPDRIDQ
jgi:hypothetical protein